MSIFVIRQLSVPEMLLILEFHTKSCGLICGNMEKIINFVPDFGTKFALVYVELGNLRNINPICASIAGFILIQYE